MNGILNVFKPTGITSFDVVRLIRKISKVKKVGHAGTLDPEASGVLPVCIGKATKAIDYIMGDFKIYETELKLGVITDTYDREGKILKESEVNSGVDEITLAIKSFIGEIKQVPPMYSALKVNGKKLYELARAGIEIEREARPITIYDINITDIKLPYIKFTVKCSKGTYIRSLCYDIGEKLKCGGMMWNLQRTATGQFHIDNAININELNEENINKYIMPIETIFSANARITIEDRFIKFLLNGVIVKDKALICKFESGIMYSIYNNDNDFIGIADKSDDGVRLIKSFI
ncbi:tRNA pseudouridine(55) synthase TruB [Clostridium estertheticum]|uniref:tRNA pseudouridine synthase B n=1 Tax=Clostridium estertheticum subsp. estertheticum TaxID=1552 RepID=A0A1J0GHS9_9CLOT|nr:tRNA pseudouridine(55) synthase TruB [Clostridium estertheticum]APC40913.1 tRNA pseudouridine(55) synthase TruB [Clostridium estertheticum subsp. estertheticum]MBU3073970.1 tRNA pseudouridine(55) synthase TruB [Clostridium estertheticum]MBU3164064.1 tRNA pseudouridine(55) synthase TruB [Clostridium estertheticum]MBZ9617224.1 tRNA pseudouridine(55) synthase TruB [Clostridium estertheticum subsp. laramiense]WAG72914.1 tRNA pseudouridine(55) synthase TruB [Clostridium estertheticum]